MKRKLLFTILLFLSGTMVYSQDIFPKSDAIWNVRMPIELGDRYAVLLGLMGDTLINDTTYQKLYLLNDTLLRPESIEHYMGAIRQSDQQVWFRVDSIRRREGYMSDEFLLCDFSLKKGDKFTYGDILFTRPTSLNFPSIQYEDNEEGEIVSCPFGTVDSVMIDDKGRRHIFVDYWCYYQDEWIEGIGSVHGLFFHFYYPPAHQLGEDTKSRLQCMKYKDEVLYKLEEKGAICNKCFCMSHFVVEIREEVKGDIRLYVPFSDRKCIRLEVPEEELPCRMELYNVSGMAVFSQTIRESLTAINLDFLNGGTYIYRISHFGKAVQQGKIVIN